MTTRPTPRELASMPVDLPYRDPTPLLAYLGELLGALWAEGSDFSSKRPLGDSDWQDVVYRSMVAAGYVAGEVDEDGYLLEVDHRAADRLVVDLVTQLYRPDPWAVGVSPAPPGRTPS